MGIETHVSTGELGPGGHLRMLTPAEWQNWLVRGATWPEVGAGMAWVTSPLGALVEVLSGSAEHVLCLRHQSVERAALARRLARPEIAAEAAFNQDRMGDFEALAMANDAVVPHILKLFIWSPRRTLPAGASLRDQALFQSRGNALRGAEVLSQAQHLARSIAARRAAMEAVDSQYNYSDCEVHSYK